MAYGNLGIALGAATDEFNNQRRMARDDEAAARAKEQFGWQKQDQERRTRIQSDQDAIMQEARDYANYSTELSQLPDDQLGSFSQRLIEKYNKHPAYQNGQFANMAVIDGKPHIVHGNMARVGGVQTIPVTREMLAQGLEHMGSTIRQRLAMTSPEGYGQYHDAERTFKQGDRKIAVQERANEINDAYRTGILEKPITMQDGTGKVVVLSADGTRQIGTYGNARPILGHGGGGGSGAQRENWVPIGADTDGTPIFYNSKGINPRNPQESFLRPDGKPVQNMNGVYAKFSGTKPAPEIHPKVIEKAADELATYGENWGPKQEAAFRTRWGAAADQILGPDPMMAAAGAAFGNRKQGGLNLPQPGSGAPTEPYLTTRGSKFVVVDPARGAMSTADYERITGNAWADLPRR